MTLAENKNRIFFPNLDGLRFFCFLSVFFYHSFATHYDYIKQAGLYIFIKTRLVDNGELGVNFFFVLSGYLITFLLLKEKELTDKISIKDFYIRRVLRIWPLYFFCVFFGFVVFPYLKNMSAQPYIETAHPLSYLTFLCNFDMIKHGPPGCSSLSVLWSLGVEEQFYFIWPILLAFIPGKYYKYVLWSVIIIAFTFRLAFDNFVVGQMNTLVCISDMAVGGLGAYYTYRPGKTLSFIRGANKYLVWLLYAVLLLVFFLRQQIFAIPVLLPFERIFTGFVFLCIILEQNFCNNSIFKMGNNKTLSKLGQYTYGLYCLQIIGIYVAETILNKFKLNVTLAQLLINEGLLSLAITIALAYLSYTFFEARFLRLKKRFAHISKE